MSLQRGIPKRPVGTDPFHIWAQWVHETLTRERFNDSPTVKVNHRQNGYSFDAAPPSPAGGQLSVFQYQSSQDNYIVCTNASGATVNVAKPWWLRRQTYDNTAPYSVGAVKLPDAPYNGHTYVYVSADKRTDAITGTDSPTGATITTDSIIWIPYDIAGATKNPTPLPILAMQPQGAGASVDANGNPVLNQVQTNPQTGLPNPNYQKPITGGTGVVDINGNPVIWLDIGNRDWKLNAASCYLGSPAFILTDSPYYGNSI